MSINQSSHKHQPTTEGESVIIEEDSNYEPEEAEIEEYGQFLGMKLPQDKEFLVIAKEGLKATLPEPWKACKTPNNELYYWNSVTGESQWDHPCDEYYRNNFLKVKNNQKNGKIRSMTPPIPEKGKPLRPQTGAPTLKNLRNLPDRAVSPAVSSQRSQKNLQCITDPNLAFRQIEFQHTTSISPNNKYLNTRSPLSDNQRKTPTNKVESWNDIDEITRQVDKLTGNGQNSMQTQNTRNSPMRSVMSNEDDIERIIKGEYNFQDDKSQKSQISNKNMNQVEYFNDFEIEDLDEKQKSEKKQEKLDVIEEESLPRFNVSDSQINSNKTTIDQETIKSQRKNQISDEYVDMIWISDNLENERKIYAHQKKQELDMKANKIVQDTFFRKDEIDDEINKQQLQINKKFENELQEIGIVELDEVSSNLMKERYQVQQRIEAKNIKEEFKLKINQLSLNAEKELQELKKQQRELNEIDFEEKRQYVNKNKEDLEKQLYMAKEKQSLLQSESYLEIQKLKSEHSRKITLKLNEIEMEELRKQETDMEKMKDKLKVKMDLQRQQMLEERSNYVKELNDFKVNEMRSYYEQRHEKDISEVKSLANKELKENESSISMNLYKQQEEDLNNIKTSELKLKLINLQSQQIKFESDLTEKIETTQKQIFSHYEKEKQQIDKDLKLKIDNLKEDIKKLEYNIIIKKHYGQKINDYKIEEQKYEELFQNIEKQISLQNEKLEREKLAIEDINQQTININCITTQRDTLESDSINYQERGNKFFTPQPQITRVHTFSTLNQNNNNTFQNINPISIDDSNFSLCQQQEMNTTTGSQPQIQKLKKEISDIKTILMSKLMQNSNKSQAKRCFSNDTNKSQQNLIPKNEWMCAVNQHVQYGGDKNSNNYNNEGATYPTFQDEARFVGTTDSISDLNNHNIQFTNQTDIDDIQTPESSQRHQKALEPYFNQNKSFNHNQSKSPTKGQRDWKYVIKCEKQKLELMTENLKKDKVIIKEKQRRWFKKYQSDEVTFIKTTQSLDRFVQKMKKVEAQVNNKISALKKLEIQYKKTQNQQDLEFYYSIYEHLPCKMYTVPQDKEYKDIMQSTERIQIIDDDNDFYTNWENQFRKNYQSHQKSNQNNFQKSHNDENSFNSINTSFNNNYPSMYENHNTNYVRNYSSIGNYQSIQNTSYDALQNNFINKGLENQLKLKSAFSAQGNFLNQLKYHMDTQLYMNKYDQKISKYTSDKYYGRNRK